MILFAHLLTDYLSISRWQRGGGEEGRGRGDGSTGSNARENEVARGLVGAYVAAVSKGEVETVMFSYSIQ